MNEGPLKFQISVIGWRNGLANFIAWVTHDNKTVEREFIYRAGKWRTDGLFLNDELQVYLNLIWTEECKKKGLPYDKKD